VYEAVSKISHLLDIFSAGGIAGGIALAILGAVGVLYDLLSSARRDRKTESEILQVRHKRPDSTEPAAEEPEAGDQISLPLPSLPSEQANEQKEFDRLWEGAQARLAMYHQLAVIQGRQSFRMLLLFSSLGFGLLAFVVWKGTEVHTTAGGLALGAAGVAGAALSGYVSRTFMRAYRDANERLVDYFAEPLDMSRLLVAERLLRSVPDGERGRVVETIIDSALGRSRTSGSSEVSVPTLRGHRRRRSAVEDPGDRESAEGP
jgi:Cyanobacterial TRADD-N associated 2-Transmembrane domain